MEKAAVTCVCWVPRGKCRARPIVDEEFDDEEIAQVHDSIMGASSSSARPAAAATAQAVIGEGLDEFNLESYDDEDNDGGMQFFSVLKGDGELAKERDPYMTGNPDSDSESGEEYEIKPDDKIFIAAECEEDLCQLEMYVYDEEEAEMFVHHDLMLGAYPLCIEWLGGTAEASEGSFAVVGLIDHNIQIWDLDRQSPLLPAQVLGAPAGEKKKKGTKGKKKKNKGTAHDGAVLCIHGSDFNRSVLASGSADETVKVWDVQANSCVHVYNHHGDKVQCARWHPTEQAVLLSAAFDRHLALLDVRQPGQIAMVDLPAEAECAIWSRHKPFECIGSADNGCVACYDVRKVAAKAPANEQVLWSVQAHDVACTAVHDAPTPNLLVTSSLDGEAKVWSLAGPGPSMVYSKDLQAGPLFACQSRPDAQALFCFGGKCPVIWDLSSEQMLVDAFNLNPTAAA